VRNPSSDAIYTEGLSYAYEIARIVGDKEHQETYRSAIILGAHNLINLQFKDSNVCNFQHPERVKGAIRYRVDDNRIRIDTTQHTIDAFMKIIKVFSDDKSLSRSLIPDQKRRGL